MKRSLTLLFGRKSALLYLIVFAAAIGAATFIENDFGTSTAQAEIYQNWWFELLLVLFSGSLIYNVVQFRMIPRRQYSLATFHLSILLILLGSAVTRYSGWEGIMHIREGGQESSVITRETYLTVQLIRSDQQFRSDNKVWLSSLGTGTNFSRNYQSPIGTYRVKCLQTLVNPVPELTHGNGPGVVQVVFGGSMGRTELALSPGSPISFDGVLLFWSEENPTIEQPFVVRPVGDQFEIASIYPIVRRVMATGQVDTLEAGTWNPLMLRSLHATDIGQFVVADFDAKGGFVWASSGKKITAQTSVGLVLEVSGEGFSDTVMVTARPGAEGEWVAIQDRETHIQLACGSIIRNVPFALALDDFQMTRYPGTDAAATFASQVQVLDAQNSEQFGYSIHMNHILDYGGYRFFQSSYDNDELGTYLSVNHDWAGTWITYLGYFILTLGMIWALLARNTRFAALLRRTQSVGKSGIAVLALVFGAIGAYGQESDHNVVSAEHAEAVSRVYVQDFRGRVKPMHTLSREVLRKLSGSESVDGLSADQFMLSALLYPEEWYSVPLIIQGQSPVIHGILGSNERRISYQQCFNEDGTYRLRAEVEQAQNKMPTEKNANDKALIALDERVNIMNMVFSGQFLRWVPVEGDENNTWVGPSSHASQSRSPLATEFFSVYFGALDHGVQNGHYVQAESVLDQLADYQLKTSAALLPSPTQAKLEIAMNELRPFNWLGLVYGLLGGLFLVLLFAELFSERIESNIRLRNITYWTSAIPFVVHTVALAVRWYISERAPWSNGYESLIYIGWTSALSGLIFSRKDFGALAATNILASILMLVAMLSYLSPEITPLVPVLKSYWLTIHVSLEAGSYGFLMLGAIIGVVILLLYAISSQSNSERIGHKIAKLHAISERTIIGGLYMLSIGTYLGGIWANESWGRYWGWDAKETWALVSILVYALVLHLRFIPKLNNAYWFSVGSLVGLSSVVMTYFGVNYYLSGLHSYAAGDPIPVPNWVYWTAAFFMLLSVAAGIRRAKARSLN